MKTLLLITSIAFNVFAGTPEERLVPIEHVYAPNGFDSNDSVEIVVTGVLPNLCHKSPSSKVSVVGKTIEVKVSSLYYGENNPFCPEMVVPFMETISLGLLEEGKYDIKVNGESVMEANASITIAGALTNQVDTFNYAYVDYIEKDMISDVVVLKGYHVSDCFELDRIEYFNNKKDTYSILPILKQVSRFCPKKFTPFSYEFKVPRELDRKKVLLHVRTLNGNSVNTIFTMPE